MESPKPVEQRPTEVHVPNPVARPATAATGWRAKASEWWQAIVGFAGIAIVIFNQVLPFSEGGYKQWINTAITVISGGLLFLQQHVGKAEALIGADLNSDSMIGQ